MNKHFSRDKILPAIRLPSVPAAMEALDRLEIEISEAPSFEALDTAANVAAGMQRAFQPVKDVADRAGEIWIAAEEKLADELEKLPKATGGDAQRTRFQKGTESPPTLADLGIDKKRSARSKKIKAIPKKKRRQYIQQLKDEGRGVTPNALLAKARQEAKENKKTAISAAVFSETGPFDVVVIDPPWDMQKIDRDVRPNQDAFDYSVMSENEIIAFWTKEIAGKLKDDCHIFMWTTQKFLPVALNLLDVFDLKYVLVMVWHKPGGFQPIGLPQYNCEFAVYARKGAPMFIDTKDFKCCFEAPRREHSRKPDEFYDTIRRVTGGSRIDVFSREKREGFAQYGNEIGKFDNAQLRG